MSTAQSRPRTSVFNLLSSAVCSFSTERDGEVKVRLLSSPSFPARHKEELQKMLQSEPRACPRPCPRAFQRNALLYPKHRHALCAWKKANAARVTQQQPLHNCVVKHVRGWFISTLLKQEYVSVWFSTTGRIRNMEIWSFGDFHIWRYQKDGRKSPLSLHTRTSSALPGHVEALPATPLRPHQGHELQPLNLTWENSRSSRRSSAFRRHFFRYST